MFHQTKVFVFMKLEWSRLNNQRILSIQLVGEFKWHQITCWSGYLDGNNPEVLPSYTWVNCAVVISDKVKARSLMSEFRTIFYLFLLRICIYNLASLLITTSTNMCNNKWSENLFIGWFRYTFDIWCIDSLNAKAVTWHDLPPTLKWLSSKLHDATFSLLTKREKETEIPRSPNLLLNIFAFLDGEYVYCLYCLLIYIA